MQQLTSATENVNPLKTSKGILLISWSYLFEKPFWIVVVGLNRLCCCPKNYLKLLEKLLQDVTAGTKLSAQHIQHNISGYTLWLFISMGQKSKPHLLYFCIYLYGTEFSPDPSSPQQLISMRLKSARNPIFSTVYLYGTKSQSETLIFSAFYRYGTHARLALIFTTTVLSLWDWSQPKPSNSVLYISIAQMSSSIFCISKCLKEPEPSSSLLFISIRLQSVQNPHLFIYLSLWDWNQ
jgi:hypothetical protein